VAVAFGQAISLPDAAAGLAVSQLDGRAGLRLVGQADVRTVDLMKQAIAALPPDADEVHLQLAGLDFIDVAAARELVMLARPSLVLHYPPPVLLRLLSLCWPEARSRFSIGTARRDST
jgi:hypothetical protein